MNVEESDIVNIRFEELSSYRGEKVLLPMHGYFNYSKDFPAVPTSPDIVPVYLGFHTTSKNYIKNKPYWKEQKIVGCRDEATWTAMTQEGYSAFLTGCMTVLFPKRECTPKKERVFLVDAHPKIEPYIPANLRDKIEYISHDVKVDKKLSTKEQIEMGEKITRDIYRRYAEEAILVVTSRLHCAAPCLAMGIPVILARDGFDERYGWLDKFLPLYTPETFAEIDWNPARIDLEAHKKLVMQLAVSIIRQQPEEEDLLAVQNFYLNREKHTLSPSLMVRGYICLSQYCPDLANFLREKVLFRFTISAKSRENERNERKK